MIFAVIVENRAYIPGTRFRGKCSTQGKCASDRQSAERRIVEAPSSPHKRFPNPEAHFRELFDRVPDEERPRLAGGFVFRPIQILLKFEADVVDRREDFHLRLRKHGVAQHVAAGVFGDEALPFMVHEDEAVHLRRECRIVLHVQRLFGNALDVVHTAGFRADVDHVHEHFARGAGLIRRAEFFETRIVNAAHLGIGRKTARAGNDALRCADV